MQTTFVMPNYNHAAYLHKSIGAMLAQTKPADEVIIIDDASTDNSLEIIDELTLNRPNVHVVRNSTNAGVVQALQAGLARATGDFVAFLGADDCVAPHFLSMTSALLEAHPGAGFACGRAEIRDGDNRLLAERPIIRPTRTMRYVSASEAAQQLTKADNFFLGPVTLYHRARLLELGGFDEALGALSDGLIQRRLAVRWGYAFTPDILGTWRIHGANYSVTSASDAAVLERLIAAGKALIEREPTGLFPAGYPELFERRLRFNSARLMAGNLTQQPDPGGAIARIMGGKPIDQSVLSATTRLGKLSWVATMAWLFVRLRPLSMGWLLSEIGIRARARFGLLT